MDQSTWNLLFGWTGRQCFIPEGCPPPSGGVIAYAALTTVVAAALYLAYRRKDRVSSWIK
ncbi:MAG: hypothetical protein ABEJ91_00450 [Candidatus Nanohaloarchaea archaeon]